MDGQMSTSRILILAIALGFAAGFSWVYLTGGPVAIQQVYASAD